jgi:catechol 2,3-dioxygenase-like lactoylglutathione lyase family enzyme
MDLHGLDHFTMRTNDLFASVSLYQDIIGLHPGPRPKTSVPGSWLYSDNCPNPLVHLVQVQELCSRGDGALDHVAFRAAGLSQFLRNLRDAGQAYHTQPIQQLDVVQVFLRDPSGVSVEVNFYAEGLPAAEPSPS